MIPESSPTSPTSSLASTSVPEKLVWISSPKDVMDRGSVLLESCVANCTSSPEDMVENIPLCSTWRRLRMKRPTRTAFSLIRRWTLVSEWWAGGREIWKVRDVRLDDEDDVTDLAWQSG